MSENLNIACDEPCQDVVIFGTSSFGELAHYFFTHDSKYNVRAFTAHRKFVRSDVKFELPVVPFENLTERFPPKEYALFVAVGYRNVNQTRAEVFTDAKSKGYELVSYVHSSATVAGNVEIGENTFVFEDQTIQPFVEIGDNVVLWSGNHIGHHSTIGDHCFLTSHVVVSGHCKVEKYSFVGVNATIINELTIGERSVIAAGATIIKDTMPGEVYIGTAAKLHSDNSSQSDI